MSTEEQRDILRLTSLGSLLEQAARVPIGDILAEASLIFEEIELQLHRYLAEEAMRGIRALASRAQPNDKLFADPPDLPRELTDLEYMQLFGIEREIHELCYCCETVQTASEITWGGSTPTRFYLNSIYYYTSSIFLVDISKPTHQDLPMGGTAIKAMHPLGLAELLDPIREVLDEPFGETTLGEVILKLRHSHLVHGDFSPERIEYLIGQTDMRNPMQQERFAQLIWIMFHRLLLLDLKLLAVMSATGKDLGSVVMSYLKDRS